MKREITQVHQDVIDFAAELARLENLKAGRRVCARDGCHFIRTDRFCESFCDLNSGQICTAKDVILKHGGMKAEQLDMTSPAGV